MLLEDFSKRKQDFKIKKLKNAIRIFNKKLKYDKIKKKNKSESKKIKKDIQKINDKKESVFAHYSNIEKNLIEYFAEIFLKYYSKEGSPTPQQKEINSINLKLIEILKKKRKKILEEDKKELEKIIFNYQRKEDKRREDIVHSQLGKDYIVFKKILEKKEEIENLMPNFRDLEKECNELSIINGDLKRKWEIIKIENKCLLILLNNLNKKKEKKNYSNSITINNNNNIYKLYKNKSLILKNKIINNKNNNIHINNSLSPISSKSKNNNSSFSFRNFKSTFSNSTIFSSSPKYSSIDAIKKYYNFSYNNFNKKKRRIKSNIFFSENQSGTLISNKIFKKTQKKRIFYPKNNMNDSCNDNNSNNIHFKKINNYIYKKNNNESMDKNIENNDNKNIIDLLKELIKNNEHKYQEKHKLYSKELEFQSIIKNFMNQCIEDLNLEYKELKNEVKIVEKKEKNNNKENILYNINENINLIEQKLFIFSYIYDNCLNNGEIKELKKQYSMFQKPKK